MVTKVIRSMRNSNHICIASTTPFRLIQYKESEGIEPPLNLSYAHKTARESTRRFIAKTLGYHFDAFSERKAWSGYNLVLGELN